MAPSVLSVHHRGIDVQILAVTRVDGQTVFGFELWQDGLRLHAARPVYRTAVSSERGARRFVDDALAAYDAARAMQAAL